MVAVAQPETGLRHQIRQHCMQRDHRLVKIYSAGTNREADVVRWCTLCGSIVVDVDFDGRTNPGQVMRMRNPGLYTELLQKKSA